MKEAKSCFTGKGCARTAHMGSCPLSPAMLIARSLHLFPLHGRAHNL